MYLFSIMYIVNSTWTTCFSVCIQIKQTVFPPFTFFQLEMFHTAPHRIAPPTSMHTKNLDMRWNLMLCWMVTLHIVYLCYIFGDFVFFSYGLWPYSVCCTVQSKYSVKSHLSIGITISHTQIPTKCYSVCAMCAHIVTSR